MEYRQKKQINDNWETYYSEDGKLIAKAPWRTVQIPHNHDNYHGYHRVSHGNLHGSAWYRKYFRFEGLTEDQRSFVMFEGVGSYATVWLNGEKVGYHAGGRTTFTLEMTEHLKKECVNELLVLAEHPEKINDLPWVCGGCFGTPNTEGSQPLGIFRPVSIYTTGQVRIRPYGVHILTTEISEKKAKITIRTEMDKGNLKNSRSIERIHQIKNAEGIVLAETSEDIPVNKIPGIAESVMHIDNPMLWNLEQPYLYYVDTQIVIDGELSDQVTNSFGVRSIEWENFDNAPNEVVAPLKLHEEPCEKNQYFVKYTRGGVHSKVGIVPGGVKISLPECSADNIIIGISTTIVNRDSTHHTIQLESFVQTYNETKSIANLTMEISLEPGEMKEVYQETERLSFLDFWSEEVPTLHSVVSTVRGLDEVLKEYNQTKTSFRIYQKEKTANRGYAYQFIESETQKVKRRLLINGIPVFIDGTCEYEHLFGNDHAFYTEQIMARIKQIKAAGFNAFREAHCPHNLTYLQACDEMGILYWAQMGAHLYFDTDVFRKNFMVLTEEWVRERRNSPSVFLWGIQNESMLPTAFTDEVKTLIRRLDDTSPEQRKTCTCNGGSGSDWNIPQNWSGTYGRSVEDYGEEVISQRLIGEYGQYRVIGKHEEGDMKEKQNKGGNVSEELFAYCMETKIRLAEENKDYFYGHFQWIFNSHANPGREVMYCLDGSGLDSVGVVNSKGLITCWGEPVDAYYMYRSNYAPKDTEPMVYIVSHTWPDRFKEVGECHDIVIYSNCDEVELWNNATGTGTSRGRQRRGKRGSHFLFKNMAGKYSVFTAKGYIDGKVAAEDRIGLVNLPNPCDFNDYIGAEKAIDGTEKDFIYRLNCGGSEYVDCNGTLWKADVPAQKAGYGWKSWAMQYPEVDPALGSVRRTFSPILHTYNQELFQTYRYGREQLSYHFPVQEGRYEIYLYVIEPWYGIGGGMDCTGWRLFDVAVNGEIMFKNVDIWREVGSNQVYKLICQVEAKDVIDIEFPRVKSYQCILCAIGIKPII